MLLNPDRLIAIRKRLSLSQEQMARLLGVSFASVNRWEGSHSTPTGSTLDLYVAIEAALRAGNTPEAILQAADKERGIFLYTIFRMAYGQARRSG
jgi:transcriptional regulator with XRE-family HTH domain